MRRSSVLVMVVSAVVLSAQSSAPRPASVEGVVTDSVTGAPLLRAHVRLVGNGGSNTYNASTDSEGKFSVSRMEAGTYSVRLDKAGYVPENASRNSVTLDAGEKKTNLKLTLIPGGVITGRVLDPAGRPLLGVVVSASSDGDALTDDEGRFRLHSLRPGRVKVQAEKISHGLPPEHRVEGTQETVLARTAYPNRITVRPGAEVSGIEIRLSEVPILKVAGRVSGLPEGTRADVKLRAMDSGDAVGTDSVSITKPDGTFECWRVTPGKHWIWAEVRSNSAPLHAPPIEIAVDSTDVENVELGLLPRENVRGAIRWEGDPPTASAGGLRRVVLHPMSTFNMARDAWDAALQDDGSFNIEKVQPAKYRVEVQGAGAFVKSVTVSSRASDGDILDLTHGTGGEPVSLVLSTTFASVQGVVRKGGDPALDLRVLLVDDPASVRTPLGTTTGPDGSYRINNVPPGVYRVMLLDSTATWKFGQSAEEGTEITLAPKENATRDLRFTPPGERE